MVGAILTTNEIQREDAVLAQAGETLPARNARLRAARIAEKAQARSRIAAIVASTVDTPPRSA